MNLKGLITALVTPFIGEELDEDGLATNIDYQLSSGVDGILVLGTTGETPTLTDEEQTRIMTIAVKKAKGKIPVWVGTGSNCTRKTIQITKKAQDLGADVALIVVPYYNKPSQEGLYRHFEAIANSVEIPIIIYNHPGRCGINIETATLARIAKLPNIAGIKECSGNINQVSDIIHTIKNYHPNFLVFSGDDALALPMIALGAVGLISVVSNLIPKEIASLVKASLQQDFDRARKIQHQLLPLFTMAFIEPNPVPIKMAMDLYGLPAGCCRLPLYRMNEKNIRMLFNLLMQMKLIAPELCSTEKS